MPAAISKNSLDVILPPARTAFPGPSAQGDSYASVANELQAQGRSGNNLPPGGKSAEQTANAHTSAHDTSVASQSVASDKSAEASAENQERTAAASKAVGLVVETMADDASQDAVINEVNENMLVVGAALAATRRADRDAQGDGDEDAEEDPDALLISALAADEQGEMLAEIDIAADTAGTAAEQAAEDAANKALDRSLDATAGQADDEIALVQGRDAALSAAALSAAAISDDDQPATDAADTDDNELVVGAGTTNARSSGTERASAAGVEPGQQPAGTERLTASLRGSGGEAQSEQLQTSQTPGPLAHTSNADASPLTPFQQVSSLVAMKAAVAAPAQLVLPNTVGDPGWSEGLSGRITMMVNQKVGVATIHLNPADLGPIEVKVNLNHDQASVQFVSHAAQVRDALEQTIPRLREMLDDAGFTLIDSQVSDQSERQERQPQQRQSDGGSLPDIEQGRAEAVPVGMIDYYA